MRNLVQIIEEINYYTSHMVEIGILGVDKDLKGKDGKTTVLNYAVYNEFGTKTISPRPFMRRTIENNGKEISDYINKRTEEVIDGKISGRQALMQIGEFIRGKITLNIATATKWATPLSSNTLKKKLKKGSNNTKILKDEGFLVKYIRYQITSKSGKQVFVSEYNKVPNE